LCSATLGADTKVALLRTAEPHYWAVEDIARSVLEHIPEVVEDCRNWVSEVD